MPSALFKRYADAIRGFGGSSLTDSLKIAVDGRLTVYYAPFDWVNPNARIVLVGITPGRTQAINALNEAKRQLEHGATEQEALIRAKQTAAFSGSMRKNLIAMLERVELPAALGVADGEALFTTSSHLVQTISVLPFPVLIDGKDYKDQPPILRTSLLKSQMFEHFVPVARALSGATFLPLGTVPNATLTWLVDNGHLNATQVLSGMPHPSNASRERVDYFVGRKLRSALSSKTNATKLDAALANLRSGVARLRRAV